MVKKLYYKIKIDCYIKSIKFKYFEKNYYLIYLVHLIIYFYIKFQ
jgi:hypothetical protein